jgi:hypothetical protein
MPGCRRCGTTRSGSIEAGRLACYFVDPRDHIRTQHRVASILRSRMLMFAAGDEDDIDANGLRAT